MPSNGPSPSLEAWSKRRYNGRARTESIARYVDFINKPSGVIRRNWAVEVISDLGFQIGDEAARSLVDKDQFMDAILSYGKRSIYQVDKTVWQKSFSNVRRLFVRLEGTLPVLSATEVAKYWTKPDTSSGLPFLTKKREILVDGLEEAYDIMEFKSKPEPCIAYYRTQTSVKEQAFKQKTRLVWGYPVAMTILEGKFARPIIEALKHGSFPIVYGKTKLSVGTSMSSISWSPFMLGLDWSKFDSTVSIQVLSQAFNLIERWFDPEMLEEQRSVWEQVKEYFMHCDILAPDGSVRHFRSIGIPSGSYFTNIIGSVCNMLIVNYLLLKQEIGVNVGYFLGDDSLLGLSVNPNLKLMATDALNDFGMVINPTKQHFTKYDHRPVFLGHEWYMARPIRPMLETVQRVAYPERYIKETRQDQINLLMSLYGDNFLAWPLLAKIMSRQLRINLANTGEFPLVAVDVSGFGRPGETVSVPKNPTLFAFI